MATLTDGVTGYGHTAHLAAENRKLQRLVQELREANAVLRDAIDVKDKRIYALLKQGCVCGERGQCAYCRRDDAR